MNAPAVLVKGANTVLGQEDELLAVLIDVGWRSPGLECDLSVLVCGFDRQVLDDEHFVFYNQPITPERSVFLKVARDQEHSQVVVDLTELPARSERLVIALSTVIPDATLSDVQDLRVTAHDSQNAAALASYDLADGVTEERCLILAEIYRHSGKWKFRAVGQGYASGLEGLGRDFGVAF